MPWASCGNRGNTSTARQKAAPAAPSGGHRSGAIVAARQPHRHHHDGERVVSGDDEVDEAGHGSRDDHGGALHVASGRPADCS